MAEIEKLRRAWARVERPRVFVAPRQAAKVQLKTVPKNENTRQYRLGEAFLSPAYLPFASKPRRCYKIHGLVHEEKWLENQSLTLVDYAHDGLIHRA